MADCGVAPPPHFADFVPFFEGEGAGGGAGGQIETGRINDLSNLMFLLDFLTEPELTTATISPRIAD